MNRPLETDTTSQNMILQTRTDQAASRENPIEEHKGSRSSREQDQDQDAELPEKRRRKQSNAPNDNHQSFGSKSGSVGHGGGPSMADSMNRSFTRKSPVKQPRGVQNQQSPRDKDSAQNSERNAPFK